MKTSVYKKTAIAATLLLGASQANSVLAHDQIGSLAAASGAKATDVYEVECYQQGSGPVSDHLTAQIKDNKAGGPVMSLQIIKGLIAVNTTDAIGGDSLPVGSPVGSTANYSPEVQLNGGDGFYTILVNHTAAATETYAFQYHCEAADGVTHTGTLFNQNPPYQNQ